MGMTSRYTLDTDNIFLFIWAFLEMAHIHNNPGNETGP